MEKLTKENIYINLKGKSNDELTELYGFLKSVGEKIYVSLLDMIDNKYWNRFEFYENVWQLSRSKSNKQEVTIQQLKEILQPMYKFTPIAMRCTQEQFEAIKPKLNKNTEILYYRFGDFSNLHYLTNCFNGKKNNITNIELGLDSYDRTVHERWNEEIFLKACGIEVDTLEQQLKKEAKERGYTNTNFICLMNTKSEGSPDLNKWYYYESMDILFTNEKGLGGMAVYKDGVWAELTINLSLQQQLEQAEAEVNRIKELIKEESNPKVGDWCYFYDNNYKRYKAIGKLTEVTKYYHIGQFGFNTAEKITNPQLIELLEKETKLYNTNHN